MRVERAIIVVMDSVGIGALPDAGRYGDEGSNTLRGAAESAGGIHLPHLQAMGLGNVVQVPGLEAVARSTGSYGRMASKSAGKDTTSGHWEMAGIILTQPFPTYPNAFPPGLISKFESLIGRKVLGNEVASGTEIIARLGEEHLRTGRPIVYTSADSVFQIAAHEEVIPVEELYEMCRKARAMLTGENAVGRVIARPFVGSPGTFQRTARREDFSLAPPHDNLLTRTASSGMEVAAVGKISDIYAGEGVTRAEKAANNMEDVDKTLGFMRETGPGLIMANLTDFDMLYGHRNDAMGYAAALEAFDGRIPELMGALRERDVLFITADHGCDPTHPGTDHTREYVPLLAHGKEIRSVNLGTRETFADLGATVAELLDVGPLAAGDSFARELLG